MKSSTIKTFTKVHTWTGLCAGTMLFIAFYTGSITVFTHELEGWDEYSPTPVTHQNFDQAQQLLDEVLFKNPGAAQALRLHPSEPGHHGHSVYWFERMDNGTFETHSYYLSEENKIIKGENNAHLANFIYRLHFTAGLPASWGIYVLGVVCLIYALALVTGIIIFLPNFLKDLFIVRSPKNNKRFWLDAHNVVGVFSLPWHLMYAWSSAILTIGIFFLAPFQFVAFEEDLLELLGPELGVVQPLEPSGEKAQLLPVAEAMRIAQEHIPGIEANQLRYEHAGDTNGTIRVFGSIADGSLSPRASVTMSSVTGEVIDVSEPQQATIGSTIYSGLVSLHYVTFGGYTAKWVYFFLGLAGAFLFFSGNLLWVESRRKRRKTKQRKDTIFLSKLNIGVCVGCMAGVSAAFLMSRATADMTSRPDLTEYAYYVVFFSSVFWCFLRSVANGARDLLYLCSLLTLAIPIFDVIYTDMPFWRSPWIGEWEMFTVSILSFLGALVFGLMAKAVQKRSKNGDPNSVWATATPKTAHEGIVT